MRLEIGDVIRDVLVFGNKFRIEFLMPLDGVVELEVCNCYVTSHQKLFFPDEIGELLEFCINSLDVIIF